MEGLTDQKPLDGFWCDPQPSDRALLYRFYNYLVLTTQVNGNFDGDFPFRTTFPIGLEARSLSLNSSIKVSTSALSNDVFRLAGRVFVRLFWFFVAIGFHGIQFCFYQIIRRQKSYPPFALASYFLLRSLGIQVIVDDSQPSSQEGFVSIQAFDGSSSFKEIVAKGTFGIGSFVFAAKDVCLDESSCRGKFPSTEKFSSLRIVRDLSLIHI